MDLHNNGAGNVTFTELILLNQLQYRFLSGLSNCKWFILLFIDDADVTVILPLIARPPLIMLLSASQFQRKLG
jgi:hypothetical protein